MSRRRRACGARRTATIAVLALLAACADGGEGKAAEPVGASGSTTSTTPATSSAPTRPTFTIEPYRGLGTWVDVFDWSAEYDRTPEDPPAVGVAELAEMAARGVRTLYFQPTRFDAVEPGLVEPPQARLLVDRARELGMAVVGWYLPTHEDPAADRARIDAVLGLPLDGFALDIESVRLVDEAERDRRAVALAAELRADLPGEVLGAIVVPPVVTVHFDTYWPTFPWEELAPSFDVWLPMAYWTNRTVESGWRDAATYTADNIDLLRDLTGRRDAAVHPVGGIACCEGVGPPTTVADVDAFLATAADRGALGASLYDFATTSDELWEPMAAANDL